jgi:chaperonin GroES
VATRKSQNKKAALKAAPKVAKKKLTSAKKLAKEKKSIKAAPVKKSTKGKTVAKVKSVPAKNSAKKGAGKTKPVVASKASVKKKSAQAVLKPKPKVKEAVKSRPNAFLLQEPKKKQNSAGSSRKLQNWSLVFSPLDDRVVVQPVEASNVTAGGIIIPDSVNEKPQMGTIVAVGRGHRSAKGRVRPVDVKVGDRVLFPKYAGDQIEVDGQKLLILREADVLGVTNA